MVIRLVGLLVIAASLGVLGACRDDIGPSPVAPRLVLQFGEPVIARFVPATGIFVAEFPVTISDPDGQGGDLVFVEAVVSNRSRASVIATNRRPNVSYTFRDMRVPPRGSLTVEAGIGFEPPPPRDDIVITVRTQLTDGREAVRTAALEQQF